jgi:membrane-associated phospholipid phosphatase
MSTSPFSWKLCAKTWPVGMGERFDALLRLDALGSDSLRLKPENTFWHPAVLLAHSGDSWLWMAGLGLIWLFGRPDWHQRAALLALAVVFQALVIFTVKQLVQRERPRGDFGGIYRTFDPHSFPSGHATRAILLAVMAVGLGPPWFAVLLLLWAPLVSLARVATGLHYISDVAAGVLIGLLMGLGMLAAQGLIIRAVPFLF